MRRVAVLEGKTLCLEGAIAFLRGNKEHRKQLDKLWDFLDRLTEDQLQYLPPKVEGGSVQGAIPWVKHEYLERWVSNQTEEVVKPKEPLVTKNKDQTIVVSNSERERG